MSIHDIMQKHKKEMAMYLFVIMASMETRFKFTNSRSTEADNSQILSWEPTGVQRTAYEVKWQVYNCTEPGPRLQDWR